MFIPVPIQPARLFHSRQEMRAWGARELGGATAAAEPRVTQGTAADYYLKILVELIRQARKQPRMPRARGAAADEGADDNIDDVTDADPEPDHRV